MPNDKAEEVFTPLPPIEAPMSRQLASSDSHVPCLLRQAIEIASLHVLKGVTATHCRLVYHKLGWTEPCPHCGAARVYSVVVKTMASANGVDQNALVVLSC